MATGQDLLDRMELLDPELQLQSGESDVTRGLLALNIAQDHFESLVAVRPDVLGSGIGMVSTSNGVESTTYPSNLLRVDSLWMLDGSLPSYELENLQETGGHRGRANWFYNLVASGTNPGKPDSYWTNGTAIFWSPLPDSTYTVRWYGLQSASNITASGTFAYPDIVMLPLATFATKIIALGLDDQTDSIDALAQQTFQPVIEALANFNRTGPTGFVYSRSHDT